MKKVAGFGLILVMLSVGCGWAQSTSPALYQMRTKESNVTDRRFRKILGDNYDGQDKNRREYDDDRKRRRKKQQQQTTGNQTDNNGYGSGPDYAWPTHLIEMGIRFAPSLNLNTAEGAGSYAGFRNNGAGVRMSVGPTLDYFFFKDRYAFSTGLFYTIKRSGFQMPGSFGESRWNPGAPAKESVYNLQYLQIPATVKLFANNIGPNMRLYVQTGGLLSLKLAEHAVEPTRNGLYMAESGGSRRQYGFGDIELLLGAGVQYRVNENNAFNIGMSYQRGLINVARANELTSKNRVVSLDLGFKF
ncbi:porin family protein [Spirosoma fluviale]|uniref:Outer membrane protein beta-barrel domain-containing protein n=1 Tax=Spirosoma fluviale TaxID=1597977 RepID=A0A286GJX9_9BACT|nr:outer membrane beta-barrel protein [Spirosoma fluviale]SOD95782.1 Outer membrane protein beta-barrel domain-containing protein [Spirosoma fluviale]